MKNIAVYCGASSGNKKVYTDAAKDLGHWIVKKGYGLTYGGVKLGLMGVQLLTRFSMTVVMSMETSPQI